MKKFIFTFYILLSVLFTRAQNGLENIIVEKYYISNANDTANSIIGGTLPIGSITYRIYANMLPGYKFQAAFGIPDHMLKIATTTTFFNNEYKGRNSGNVIPYINLKENTVMLDSWLSTGAASEGTVGVPKEDDDTTSTIVHEQKFLLNDNKEAGIPLKTRDGMRIVGVGKTPKMTYFGIDNDLRPFHNRSLDSSFTTTNGSWACLGGAAGPDSLSNKVLIAQITTDGVFSFELNIQIGTPYRGVERYVAKNPKPNEIQIPSLIYESVQTKSESSNNKKKKKNDIELTKP